MRLSHSSHLFAAMTLALTPSSSAATPEESLPLPAAFQISSYSVCRHAANPVWHPLPAGKGRLALGALQGLSRFTIPRRPGLHVQPPPIRYGLRLIPAHGSPLAPIDFYFAGDRLVHSAGKLWELPLASHAALLREFESALRR